MKAFVVCAGLSACGSLPKIETAQLAPPSPASKTLPMPDNNVSGKDSPSLGFTDFFSQYSFMRHRCVKIPENDFTYETDVWIWDCSGIRPTESGDFLIKQLLETEYKKRTGTFVAPKSYMDKQVFNFVG